MIWPSSSLLWKIACLQALLPLCLTLPHSDQSDTDVSDTGRPMNDYAPEPASRRQVDSSIAEHIDSDELLRIARTERDTRLLLQRQDKAMDYFRNEVYKREQKKKNKKKKQHKGKTMPPYMEPLPKHPNSKKHIRFNDTHSLSLEGGSNGSFNGTRILKGADLLKSSKNALLVTKKEYLKSDWCKTQPVMQRIKEEGCISQPFMNNFCYGQCNSFYIPRNIKSRGQSGDDAFKSCAFCKPRNADWKVVTLKCPGLNPPHRKKRIQYVQQCKCITEVLS